MVAVKKILIEGVKGGKFALASGGEANNREKLEKSTVRRTTSIYKLIVLLHI